MSSNSDFCITLLAAILTSLYMHRRQFLAKGTGRRRREKLKDALIGVLRDRHDPETWSGILAEAQVLSEREGL